MGLILITQKHNLILDAIANGPLNATQIGDAIGRTSKPTRTALQYLISVGAVWRDGDLYWPIVGLSIQVTTIPRMKKRVNIDGHYLPDGITASALKHRTALERAWA